MMQLLDWSYEKALNGLPGTPDAFELANDYFGQDAVTIL